MKELDRIWHEHEKNGTDPLDDPAFLAAFQEEDDDTPPLEGAQWNPAWVNEQLYEVKSPMSKAPQERLDPS